MKGPEVSGFTMAELFSRKTCHFSRVKSDYLTLNDASSLSRSQHQQIIQSTRNSQTQLTTTRHITDPMYNIEYTQIRHYYSYLTLLPPVTRPRKGPADLQPPPGENHGDHHAHSAPRHHSTSPYVSTSTNAFRHFRIVKCPTIDNYRPDPQHGSPELIQLNTQGSTLFLPTAPITRVNMSAGNGALV